MQVVFYYKLYLEMHFYLYKCMCFLYIQMYDLFMILTKHIYYSMCHCTIKKNQFRNPFKLKKITIQNIQRKQV